MIIENIDIAYMLKISSSSRAFLHHLWRELLEGDVGRSIGQNQFTVDL